MMVNRPDPASIVICFRHELLESGWSDRAISAMLRGGEWIRVRHGAYTVTAQWRQLDMAGRHIVRTRAVLSSAKTKVAASHPSAAIVYGAPTWGLPLADVHLTRADGRAGRHEARVHQHCGALGEGDVTEHRGIAVTSPTRTALDVCSVASVEAAVGTVSHLLHAGLTRPDLLRSRYERAEDSMVHWPHSRATELVLRLANERFESIGEARTFFLLWQAHLPAPSPQYSIIDETGREIAAVDFAWPDLGVFIEFDGKVKYEALRKPGQSASDVVVREKRREERICRLTGWRCLRLTWADLENPERTVETIRAFLYR